MNAMYTMKVSELIHNSMDQDQFRVKLDCDLYTFLMSFVGVEHCLDTAKIYDEKYQSHVVKVTITAPSNRYFTTIYKGLAKIFKEYESHD